MYFLHLPFSQQNIYPLYTWFSDSHFISRISSDSTPPIGKNLRFRQDTRKQRSESTGELGNRHNLVRIETCKNGLEPVEFLVFMVLMLRVDQCYHSTGCVLCTIEIWKSLWSEEQSVYLEDISHEGEKDTPGVEKTREREPQILLKNEILVESLTDWLLDPTRLKKSQVFTANVERDELKVSHCTKERVGLLGATKLIAYKDKSISTLFEEPDKIQHLYGIVFTGFRMQDYLA